MNYCFAFLIMSAASLFTGSLGQDNVCTSPQRVFRKWAESCCARQIMTKLVTDFTQGKTNLTSSDLIAFVRQYCGEIKPKVEECFTKAIEDCPQADQISVQHYAQKTSAICNSDTNTVRQEILNFLGLDVFGTIELSESCEAMVTSLNSVAAFNPDDQRYSHSKLNDFKTTAERFFLNEARQIIAAAKKHQSTCTQWKWHALKRILYDNDLIRPEPFSVEIKNIQELLNLFSDE